MAVPASNVKTLRDDLRNRAIKRRLGTYEDPMTAPQTVEPVGGTEWLYSQGPGVQAKVVRPTEIEERMGLAAQGLSSPYESQMNQTVSIGRNALSAAIERRKFAEEETRRKEAADKLYAAHQGSLAAQNANSANQSYTGDPNSPWQLPLSNFTITARYGQKGRMWKTSHGGIDLAAPTGTPIRSVRPGTVTKVEFHPAFGNVVWVDIGNGLTTRYGHMSKFGDVRAGQAIDPSTILGYVGQTGNASGPHLHLGFYNQKGQTLNPEDYIGSLLR